MPKKLLFVDTNIWLDFYRARSEAGLSLLRHLDSIRNQIIMTYVVEMEFKKNLYFEAHALEVWLCNEQGKIKFYNEQGELAQSLLVPSFPNQIKR